MPRQAELTDDKNQEGDDLANYIQLLRDHLNYRYLLFLMQINLYPQHQSTIKPDSIIVF
jgi:hypothetical protein